MKRAILLFIIFVMASAASCSKKTDGLMQLEKPGEKDVTAEITVRNFGVMKLRLFPEEAPLTVENFVKLSEDGFYDGLPFSMIVKDYVIQCAAAEEGNAASSFGGYFEDEISEKLYPLRGALCMANLGEAGTNSSQFFIVGQSASDLEEIDKLAAYKGYKIEEYIELGYGTQISDEELAKYFEYGGIPWLYGHNTVFGQMYEGFEVLESIMKVNVEGQGSYAPVDEVIIDSIKIIRSED